MPDSLLLAMAWDVEYSFTLFEYTTVIGLIEKLTGQLLGR